MSSIEKDNQSTYRNWVIGLLAIVSIGITSTLTERITTRRAEVNFREKMYEFVLDEKQHRLEMEARLKDLEIHAEKTHKDIDDIQKNGCMSYQRWLKEHKEEDLKKNNND